MKTKEEVTKNTNKPPYEPKVKPANAINAGCLRMPHQVIANSLNGGIEPLVLGADSWYFQAIANKQIAPNTDTAPSAACQL